MQSVMTERRAITLPLLLTSVLLTVLSLALFIWLGLPSLERYATDVQLLHGEWRIHEGPHARGADPALDTDAWDPVQLPTSRGLQPHRSRHERWYRHAVTITPEQLRRWAGGSGILLGRIERTDETWLNGVQVGATGDMAHPELTDPFAPRLYAFPPALLRTNLPNIVAIRVRNLHPNEHGPRGHALAMGRLSDLSALARWDAIPYAVIGAMLLGLGLFLSILAHASREQRGLIAFAIATALLGLMSMLRVTWLMNLDFDPRLVRNLCHAGTFTAPPLFLYFVCHGILSRDHRRLRRFSTLFLLYPLVALLLTVPRGPEALYQWDLYVNDPIVIGTALIGLAVTIHQFLRRERDSGVLLLALGVFAATVIIEVFTGQLHWNLPRRLHLAGLLLMVQGMAIVLARRINRLHEQTREANTSLQLLNETLEEQVNRRTAELESSRSALEEQSRQHRELLQVLCHDLANPLSGMLSIAELLEQNPAAVGRLLPLLQTSANAAKGTLELVRRLRFVEDAPLSLEPVRLSTAFHQASQLLDTQAKAKQIDLRASVASDLWVSAESTSLVSSVLANILTNAIKFTPRGGTVQLTATRGQHRVDIVCRDSGIGMPEETRRRVFELGSHCSRCGTDGERGTGFGLPLVDRFVRAYGGEVRIDSREAGAAGGPSGTTVHIRLHGAERPRGEPPWGPYRRRHAGPTPTPPPA